MRYHVFSPAPAYHTALLVSDIEPDQILHTYASGTQLKSEDILALTLEGEPGKKKASKKFIVQYINEELIPVFKSMGTKTILCTDGEYFKTLAGITKVDAYQGYALDCVFGPWKVMYLPSYKAIYYNPVAVTAKITYALDSYEALQLGTYQDPGSHVLVNPCYPMTVPEIESQLQSLLARDCDLTCDIEAFSLKHFSSGIGTISFAWNDREGIAFPVDLHPDAVQIRELLRNFFQKHRKRLIFHKAAFDVYVLIYQLYMENILDTAGLLKGLEIFMPRTDCTLITAYLATNSCAGNMLSLKQLGQEHAGNYAVEEIKDIRKIPLPNLLEYNLVDSATTWYVENKYRPQMIADNQLDIYNNLFKPGLVDIIQMQLTGLPVNMAEVAKARAILEVEEAKELHAIRNNPHVKAYIEEEEKAAVIEYNATRKVKRITLDDVKGQIEFNPNSPVQISELLFKHLELPILERTKEGNPKASKDVLKDLESHTHDGHVKGLLYHLQQFKDANKILSTFIPAFEGAQQGPDGWHYLFGNFNLGGTVSGRLSSSDPNLQNLPANSKYAYLIKNCVEAPPGWVFAGLDFDSLEDKISALTTKDPNKLKVYTDGYDGHCLRAHAYFGDNMPDIDPGSVVSINSIAKKYKDFRQDSKTPTFALTYQGTYATLMRKCGFSQSKAKSVENSYRELYKVSIDYITDKLKEASKTGFVTCAFGLRVRTPLLAQSIANTNRTPAEVMAEGRTAGNALGQSWCLLNTRAGVEFNAEVRRSSFRLDIRPCAQIHDAQYHLVRDDINVVKFYNDKLVKAVAWQDHPEIYHDKVKLSGSVDIFYPNWNKKVTLPHNASNSEIMESIRNFLDKSND